MSDPIDNIIESILADDSPLTPEDMEEVRQFDTVIAIARIRVVVEGISERYLNGALACAGRGHDTVPVNIVAQHIKEMGEEISAVLRKSGNVWNHDISQAPADGTSIWAACKDGKVYRTHWLEPDRRHRRPQGRWCFLGSEEQPVAWQAYVIPEHPFATALPGQSN